MREIEDSAEIQRILALPRREPQVSEELIDQLTELLSVRDRCPGANEEPDENGLCRVCECPVRLNELQALALYEIGLYGGAFISADVGEGKTLISLLAPHVLDAKRPLLVLLAHLKEKTEREIEKYRRHWLIPTNICLFSYQTLSRVGSATWLEEKYQPDLMMLDEAQSAKDLTTSVVRRLARYMAKNPDTIFIPMTGSIMSKSIQDFAHLLAWSLKDRAPIPLSKAQIEEFSLALDEKIDNEFCRIKPGALLKFCRPEDFDPQVFQLDRDVIAARRGFKRRLRETPGVVCSDEAGTVVEYDGPNGERLPVALTIRALRYDVAPITEQHFTALRAGITPDGFDIMEAAEQWRHARELALGFHQVWDPQPPDSWKDPRRAWYAFVRAVIGRSHHLDSPEHVELECDAAERGEIRMTTTLAQGIKLLAAWRAAEPTFKPNPVAKWPDDSALHVAAKWMREPGIVWVEHIPFGQRLAALTGCKYYGAKGRAADGEFIDDADASRCVIAATKANREGRNLQRKWWRNLVTAPDERSALWQQKLGRTHRPGQRSPEVTADVFLGCAEHARAWAKSISGAHAIRDTVGAQSKLLIAKIDWPTDDEFSSWTGDRWTK